MSAYSNVCMCTMGISDVHGGEGLSNPGTGVTLLVIFSVLESKLGPWQEQKISSPQPFGGRILYIFLTWNNISFYKYVIGYDL